MSKATQKPPRRVCANTDPFFYMDIYGGKGHIDNYILKVKTKQRKVSRPATYRVTRIGNQYHTECIGGIDDKHFLVN